MINNLIDQYTNNINKIKELESNNQNIILQIIDEFLKSNNQNHFILRNVSINVVVLSTINKDLFEILNQFQISQIRNKTFSVSWENNEFVFVFPNPKDAKSFIQKYHLNVDKNYNAIDRVGEGNPVIDVYNKLFDDLTCAR